MENKQTKPQTHTRVRALTEGAIFVALAFVTITHLPKKEELA